MLYILITFNNTLIPTVTVNNSGQFVHKQLNKKLNFNNGSHPANGYVMDRKQVEEPNVKKVRYIILEIFCYTWSLK